MGGDDCVQGILDDSHAPDILNVFGNVVDKSNPHGTSDAAALNLQQVADDVLSTFARLTCGGPSKSRISVKG